MCLTLCVCVGGGGELCVCETSPLYAVNVMALDMGHNLPWLMGGGVTVRTACQIIPPYAVITLDMDYLHLHMCTYIHVCV